MKLLLLSVLILTGTVYSQDKKESAETENKTTIDKTEEIFTKSLDFLDELIVIIESAENQETAKEAIKKIQVLEGKAKTIRKKFNEAGLNTLSPQKQKLLLKKFNRRINSSSLRLLNAIEQVKDKKELSKTITELLSKI